MEKGHGAFTSISVFFDASAQDSFPLPSFDVRPPPTDSQNVYIHVLLVLLRSELLTV